MEGPGSTSELRGTRFRRWLGSREGGGGGSAWRPWAAATMAWAAAFQDAGSGVGAWFGVERRGEERERGVAKQKGEERAAEGSSRRGWARRRGNGGGCGSRAREQKLASAFMGEQEEERGWARRSRGRTGSSGRAGSSRGARPDAAGAERPSELGVHGRSGASATARARRVLEWGGDGAAQRGNSVAAVGSANGRQRRSVCGCACSSGAACAEIPGRAREREK